MFVFVFVMVVCCYCVGFYLIDWWLACYLIVVCWVIC